MQPISNGTAPAPQFFNADGNDESGFQATLANSVWPGTGSTDDSAENPPAPPQTLLSGGSLLNTQGGQLTTSAPVNTGAPSSSSSAAGPSTAAIDNSKYSSPKALAKWAPLVAGLPPDQQLAAEQALNRPIAAAEMLKAGGADAKTAMAYINANPALKTALDTAAHGGKADGTISSHDISAFISNMQKQLGGADKTLSTYQKNNPTADGQSLELVRQTAILQANMPITNAADPSDANGSAKVGNCTTQAGLQAIAQGNPGLSSALQGAANTFSQPGMFAILDQGGMTGVSLATHKPDGKYDEQNIVQWVQNQAPTTGGGFASLISSAAAQNAVAGVDTSNLNSDVFANPQNYSPAQKAAVLVQLQNTQAQVEAGSSLKNISKTDAALTQDINQLQADPGVQAYLQQAVPQNEASIVNSDPSLANAVQQYYTNDVVTGTGLQNDLDQVAQNNANSKNTPESNASALNDFSSELSLQSDLRGGNVPTEAQIVAGNAGLTNQLQFDYKNDFSQGGELSQLLAQKGSDPTQALQTVQGDEASFETALSPTFIQSQSGAYNTESSSLVQTKLIDTGSGKDVLAGLGQGGSANAQEIAASIAATEPATLFAGSPAPLSQSDTTALISSFLQDLQNGSSLQDALAKYDPTSKDFDPSAAGPQVAAALQSDPNAAASIQTLLSNVAESGLLMNTGGQANAPGSTTGGGSSAAENGLNDASYALMGTGLAGQVGSMVAKSKLPAATGLAAKLAAVGDASFAVGGAITAALTLPSISGLLKSGQNWDAALSIGGAARGLVAAGTGAYDLTAWAGRSVAAGAASAYTSGNLSRLGGEVAGRVVGSVAGEAAGAATAEAIASAAGPAGIVVDVALGVGFIFTAIAQAVEKAHHQKEFANTVDPTLQQYGIPTPT